MFYGKKIIYLIIPVLLLPSCATIPKRGSSIRDNIVSRAENLIGTPYRYGGADISGFDCSGFVYYLFLIEGILLPRSTEKLFKIGKTIPFRRMKRGDLIFFKIEKEGLHVGIFAGKKIFIHASSNGVKKEILNEFWRKKIVKIKRVI